MRDRFAELERLANRREVCAEAKAVLAGVREMLAVPNPDYDECERRLDMVEQFLRDAGGGDAGMKQDWTVTGAIHYRDGTTEGFSGEWPGLTPDEADVRAEEVVNNELSRRKVKGCAVSATARGKVGLSVVQRVQWK
jgi:hypothetical protein